MTVSEFTDAVLLAQRRSICSREQVVGLANMVGQVKDIPGDIIECGSYRCGTTIALSAATVWHNAGNPKTVFAFDTFSGFAETTEFDDHKPGEFGDVDFEEVRRAVEPWPNIVLVRGRHEDTVPPFPERAVSLIFFDSDLYSSHMVCLRKFWPCLSEGGFAVFHDWNTMDCPGVQKAVLEFFEGGGTIEHTIFYGMLLVRK